VYRKYGWENANLGLLYKFAPRDVSLRRQPSRGSARRVGTEQWETLNRLYHEYIADRNGYIERNEQWAREHLLRRWNQECDIALWEEDGEATGYVVYAIRLQTGDQPWPKSFIWIRDFVALTPDAFSGLFAYLLSHDRTIAFYFRAPIDFPFSSAFVDPGVIRTDPDRMSLEADELLMLRVVDFKAAIEARPALAIANGASFTVRIHDRHAPWNEGTWRVEAAEGKCAVEQAAGTADIECDIRDFAPIYASHRAPRALAETGAVIVHDERALEAAARIFSANYAPWTADGW
jgi:predicted acetyltransferase